MLRKNQPHRKATRQKEAIERHKGVTTDTHLEGRQNPRKDAGQ